jgi:glycerol-3-phosphate dehydrogenase
MLYKRGLINGLDKSELELLTYEKIKQLEPNIASDVIGGLLCNSSVLINPVALSQKLISNAVRNKVDFKLN